MLSLRLLACPVVDHCRQDRGPAAQKKTPDRLPRAVVDGVQGRVQWHGHSIEVSLDGCAPAAAAAAILPHRATNRENAGVDPRIPCLGHRRLPCTFP
jgi:hypothetical protein